MISIYKEGAAEKEKHLWRLQPGKEIVGKANRFIEDYERLIGKMKSIG